MGTWGTGLFSNDTAADVRQQVRDLIADSMTPAEATGRLVDEYGIADEDAVDVNDFWLALAVTQHKTGHVDPVARSRALAIVDDEGELERWQPSDRRKRSAVLAKAKDLLLAEPPAPKRLRRRTRIDTSLVAGQHVRYPVGEGRPDLVLRVLEIHEDRGGRYPVVLALDWGGSERKLRKAHRLKPVAGRFGEDDEGVALGFMVTGPADPPELRILDAKTDDRTPDVGFARSQWLAKWHDIGRFFDPDGRPSETLE